MPETSYQPPRAAQGQDGETATADLAFSALRESEARFRRLAEDAPDIIFRWERRPASFVSYVSPAALDIGGYSPDEFYADPGFAWHRVHPDDRGLLRAVLEAENDRSARMVRWLHREGRVVYLSIRVSPVLDAAGAITAVEGIARDISATVQAEQSLRESEERYRTLVEAMGDDVILIIAADGRVSYANGAAGSRLGVPSGGAPGAGLADLFPPEVADNLRQNMDPLLAGGEARRFEIGLRTSGGDRWMDVSLAPIRDKAGAISSVLLVGRDITELVMMREELRALSLVDDLTGLYNRRGFSLLASQQFKLAERSGRDVTLLMGDLDGLKDINDAYGHLEGDAALVAIAGILKETCRESDVVGRLGGDEFALLVVGASAAAGEAIATRLREAMDRWNGQAAKPYVLSLSLGVALSDQGRPDSLESLLSTADALMYEQKRLRRNGRGSRA